MPLPVQVMAQTYLSSVQSSLDEMGDYKIEQMLHQAEDYISYIKTGYPDVTSEEYWSDSNVE